MADIKVQGALSQNQKTKANQPDYRTFKPIELSKELVKWAYTEYSEGRVPRIDIALWEKESEYGPFMSLSMGPTNLEAPTAGKQQNRAAGNAQRAQGRTVRPRQEEPQDEFRRPARAQARRVEPKYEGDFGGGQDGHVQGYDDEMDDAPF